eukprot:365268-Chlamydomonas_euryale.AAC.5
MPLAIEHAHYVGTLHCLLLLGAENSDPEELARQAEAVRSGQRLEEMKALLEEKRARVKELREAMEGQVSETQLMKVRLSVFEMLLVWSRVVACGLETCACV